MKTKIKLNGRDREVTVNEDVPTVVQKVNEALEFDKRFVSLTDADGEGKKIAVWADKVIAIEQAE